MRLLQNIFLSVVLILSFAYGAGAQTNVSDTKLMGLKGKVKSLVSIWKSVSGYAESVLEDKTKHQTTYFFNREGNITERIYEGGSNSKLVYSKIDGHRTSKRIELETLKNPGQRFTVLGGTEPEPIEPNEKLTKPDKRFDFKYVYEIDNRGRIIERQYQNNGELFRKRMLEYNQAGDLIKEIEEDSIAIMTYSFNYDDKGNVVEVHKTRDIKGAGADSTERIIYTELTFDSVGNWTGRRITTYSKSDPVPQYKIPATTYTFVNTESRTLTYY